MTTGVMGSSQADKTKIRDCLANTHDVVTPVAGPVSINKDGDGVREPSFLVVKDGRFVADK